MKHILALLFWAANEPPEAMQLARRAFEQAQAGQVEAAVAGLREAARIAPANALYRSALGGLFEKHGRWEEAVSEFTAAAKLDPRFRDRLESVSLEWGAALARARKFRTGLPFARQTTAAFPDSPGAAIMLGLFLTRNQQNLAAVDAYRRGVALDPQSADANVGLGIAQTNAGQSKEAAATFEEGMRRFPRDAVHRQAYGVLLAKSAEAGDRDAGAKAIAMFESALEIDPALAEPHYQLGMIALAAGDIDAAVRRLETAHRNGLDDARIHYALARAYRRGSRTSDADRHLALFETRKSAEAAQ